jgi:phenylpropionate dioxygenase-like ring-hydroxylating dioxygenase large terminal subunit
MVAVRVLMVALVLVVRNACCFEMPLWHPIGTRSSLFTGKPEGVLFMGKPLVAHEKNSSHLVLHTDICPHMGASFSKGGWVSKDRVLHCPYHGFGFDEGRFAVIPSGKDGPSVCVRGHKGMRLFPVLEKNGYYYTRPDGPIVPPLPYFPPEHYDPEFVAVSGRRVLDCPVDALVENLLDMLHISYVHSFGNTDMPLPRNIKYVDIDDFSGRTSFEYSPNPNTISGRVGKADVVRVENEFYLPTTTLTRVRAGGVVKTVFTQSLPADKDKTILFWTVYRNFWKDPYTPGFSVVGDWLLHFLMDKTINEDASILSRCHPEGRKGFLTRYDVTIRKYRSKSKLFRLL